MSTIHDNYTRLWTLTEKYGGEQAVQYCNMLWALEGDYHPSDGRILLGLARAPAATVNHHAQEGGLVRHLLEMWDLWCVLTTVIPKPESSGICDATVWRAILHHDLHKGYRTYELLSQPPDWTVRFSEDQTNGLMTDEMKSLWILNDHGIKLTPQLTNALALSHGGYSKDPPKYNSVLAKLVYLLDELSGNVINRLESGNDTLGPYGKGMRLG